LVRIASAGATSNMSFARVEWCPKRAAREPWPSPRNTPRDHKLRLRFTITATTLVGGAPVDSTSATLTVQRGLMACRAREIRR